MVWEAYLSHETIRQKLIERGIAPQEEAPIKEETKPKAEVLFIEVDGIYTSIQQSKRKSKEHRIALVHRGWEKRGDRYELQDKHYYRHEGKGDFWEGFGEFILQHDDVDEKTWWIVNGDGAEWIKECENHFRNVIFVIDRFHLAKELKENLKDHPEAYKQAREAFLAYEGEKIIQIIENLTVGHTDSKAKQKWERFVTYIQNNGKYHRDYRNLLKALGKKTSTYQPMGGSEATMRLFARRIKSGGYSWSIPGVNAMIQVLISLKTTGRIPGERETGIGEINRIEQNRKAHAKELISRSVQKIKEMGKGVVQGALPYLANTSRTHPMHQALRGLKGI